MLYEVITMNNMLDRIETTFRRVEDFSSNVSHELRTPLTSLKSTIEVELMAEDDDKDAEHHKEVLLNILEDVNWMNSIIQDLLLMTRGDKQSFVIEEVNMKKLIEEIYDLVEIMAMDSNIRIHTDLEDYILKCDNRITSYNVCYTKLLRKEHIDFSRKIRLVGVALGNVARKHGEQLSLTNVNSMKRKNKIEKLKNSIRRLERNNFV